MQPLTKLLALFVAWKALLVAIALLSPTPAYDTSTEFLFQHEPPMLLRRLATGLTRWDSIYFVTSAHRGHVLEQEWAFSRFVATVTNHLASGRSLNDSLWTKFTQAHVYPQSSPAGLENQPLRS